MSEVRDLCTCIARPQANVTVTDLGRPVRWRIVSTNACPTARPATRVIKYLGGMERRIYMGGVRLCAGVLSAATLIFTTYLLLQTDSNSAIAVILICSALCLACVAPFPAISRPARERVFRVCGAYALLMWSSTVAAFLTGGPDTLGGHNIKILVVTLSVASIGLCAYAYRRKQLRRRSGWAGYLEG